GPGVHLHGWLRPERTSDDRALRMLLGLFLGELAAADQLADQRVVLRQPSERPVSEQVRAAVADMRDREVRVVEIRGGQRRSHPGALVLGARDLMDPPVGLLDAAG